MNYSNQIGHECLIWPGHSANAYTGSGADRFVEDSPRADGSYALSWEAQIVLDALDVRDRDKVATKITTWLVDQHRLGSRQPRITTAVIREATAARNLTADERAERLLRFLAQQTPSLGSAVGFPTIDHGSARLLNLDITSIPGLDIGWHALAISESVGFPELNYLLDYLGSVEWIAIAKTNYRVDCTVTVDGYRRIAEQEVNPSSDKVFVAMWFDPSMEAARENGIKQAILNTGCTPLLIDEKTDVDKIDDEIIGEIRRSRFLVADFTYGDKGIRGGVYYEAGFALGLGLEVIRSCWADQIADLHFDVNHHYHIAWNNPEELRERLERRILALVGEGPAPDSASTSKETGP